MDSHGPAYKGVAGLARAFQNSGSIKEMDVKRRQRHSGLSYQEKYKLSETDWALLLTAASEPVTGLVDL